MRSLVFLLSLLFSSQLSAQTFDEDPVLFSVTGDTVLIQNGPVRGSDGKYSTYWVLYARNAAKDSVVKIGMWISPCAQECLPIDSVHRDTMEKYHLVKKGSNIKTKEIKGLKLDVKEKDTAPGPKNRFDDRLVYSCKLDMQLMYNDSVIWSVRDFPTMYFSGSTIKKNGEVAISAWKMQGEDKYYLVINYFSRNVGNTISSKDYYYRVIL